MDKNRKRIGIGLFVLVADLGFWKSLLNLNLRKYENEKYLFTGCWKTRRYLL